MATVRVRSPVQLPPWEPPTMTRRLGMPGWGTGPRRRMRPAFSDKRPWFLVHGDRIILGLTCRVRRPAEGGDGRWLAVAHRLSAKPVLGCACVGTARPSLGPLEAVTIMEGRSPADGMSQAQGAREERPPWGQCCNDCPLKPLTLTESVKAKPSLPAQPGATALGTPGHHGPGRRGLRHGGQHRQASRLGPVPPASGTAHHCVSPAPAGGLHFPKPRCHQWHHHLNGPWTKPEEPVGPTCRLSAGARGGRLPSAKGGWPGGLGERMDGRAADERAAGLARPWLAEEAWGRGRARFWRSGGGVPWKPPSPIVGGTRWLLGPLTSPALLGQGNTGADGQCHTVLPRDLQPGRRDEDISQIWGGRRGPQFCLCTPSCESWVGGSAWWAQRASLRGGRAARPVRASGRLPAAPAFSFRVGAHRGSHPTSPTGGRGGALGQGVTPGVTCRLPAPGAVTAVLSLRTAALGFLNFLAPAWRQISCGPVGLSGLPGGLRLWPTGLKSRLKYFEE